MLTSIVRGAHITETRYELVFDDGHGNGAGFPCDASGNIINLRPEAVANLAWCMEHPEKFKRAGEVVEYHRTYKEEDYGICDCGETVYLGNQYMGACQCPKCGKWYNLFGQSLLPPEAWEEDC